MKAIAVALCFAFLNMILPATKAAAAYAPGWELNDLNGGTRTLQDWKGKWVLMKFGTTHCPNCSLELHEFAKIKDKLQKLDVHILDIYLRERKWTVKKYLAKVNVDCNQTVLYDWAGNLIDSYGISIIPHLVLVDPQGKIVWEGEFTPADELAKILEAKIHDGVSKAD